MLRNRIGKIVGLVLVGFLGISLVGCSEVENINIEDTNPTVEVDEEEISERMAIVKAEAERITEEVEEYEVTTDGDTLILTYQQTKDVVEYAIENGDWEEIVNSAVGISNNIMDAMEVEENGDYFKGITVRHMIGDTDKEEYYLTIVDREVVYNYADEVNNEEEVTEETTTVEEVEVTLGMSEALEQGRTYVEYGSMSKNKLYDWLIRDGFTEEEAQYAVDEIFGK